MRPLTVSVLAKAGAASATMKAAPTNPATSLRIEPPSLRIRKSTRLYARRSDTVNVALRQMVITRHGPPDVLQPRDAADPVPGRGDVRIRVRASGVNFADIMARLGVYPDAPKPPSVVGYEVSGIVDAVGDDVERHRVGARVLALTHF